MTARGTYNCAGQNVYLWKNIDNSYEYVPEVRRTSEELRHITKVQAQAIQIREKMETQEEK